MPKAKNIELEWTLLGSQNQEAVDKFIEFHKESPETARVIYFNDKTKYTTQRIVEFKHDNGDFEIVHFTKTYGLSITNKIYGRETKKGSVIYKGGKFYSILKLRGQNQISQTTIGNLSNIFQSYSNKMYVQIIERLNSNPEFHWLKNIVGVNEMYYIAFNSIIKYKLYSYKQYLRYYYKVPAPLALAIVAKFRDHRNESLSILKTWNLHKKVLININKLKPELLQDTNFIDSCNMALTLNKRVNCVWSNKRLTQEHDEWSKQITRQLISIQPLEQLRIKDCFHKFAEISGYKMLLTNHDLMIEGSEQKHCVATYVEKVNKGECGIYRVEGFTLQISLGYSDPSKVIISQCKGLRNCSPDTNLRQQIHTKVDEFNLLGLISTNKEPVVYATDAELVEDDYNPF